jgi:hypothetical protein
MIIRSVTRARTKRDEEVRADRVHLLDLERRGFERANQGPRAARLPHVLVARRHAPVHVGRVIARVEHGVELVHVELPVGVEQACIHLRDCGEVGGARALAGLAAGVGAGARRVGTLRR